MDALAQGLSVPRDEAAEPLVRPQRGACVRDVAVEGAEVLQGVMALVMQATAINALDEMGSASSGA